MGVANAFPNDLNEFFVDKQSGITKPMRLMMSSTRKPMKA